MRSRKKPPTPAESASAEPGTTERQWGYRERARLGALGGVRLALDEAEARHEAANPTRPGVVVTRLVGQWREIDADTYRNGDDHG